ncbi:MAG: tyrosine-type recombinase/integrase [Burkholderiales bacterium]|nr:tyrosine-type recombinase/integrase [Burkholderiales bacterium]
MSTSTMIRTAVQRYLDERRRLGFDLRIAGEQLMRFARYADARGHCGPLTLDLQLGWAREHVRRTGPITWARRLEIVRPFAAYYRRFEPQTAVPDLTTFGRGHRRLAPHIYTEQEIADLLDEAGRLSPAGGLRPATYQTLFGLIASTGLRLSEALHLREADVDLRSGTLTVRQTKFNKSRRLPMHPSTVHALCNYRRVRDRAAGRDPDEPFFVSLAGRALPSRTVHGVFAQLRDRLRWVARGGHPRPRIHDLRHAFAARRVQLWHQSGATLDHGMLLLCTYLGHAKISDTYWYLTGVPELMAVVGSKFERFALAQEAEHA